MSKIISIANQKGGVGKTTTTMNLAVELHNRGYRVLCVDLDHQANLSDYLGHEPDGLPTVTHLMQAAVQNPSALPELLTAAIRTAAEGVRYIPADINLSTTEMLLAQAILFGSTEKMGAGTNVQDRLIAIHDVDCPWRPGDLEQRAGRIVRQGNRNRDVYIKRYVTDATFDAYLYQTLENKQKFISQVMTSKTPVRSCEDVDESVLSYAEIKALCAGNPLIKEKMELDTELTRLKVLRAGFKKQHYRLEDMICRSLPNSIRETEAHIVRLKQDNAHLKEVLATQIEDGFRPIKLDGAIYTSREEAGKALGEIMAGIQTTEPVYISTWFGFVVQISKNSMFVNDTYRAMIQGVCSYTVELGDSEVGNVTRIENGIKRIPEALKQSEDYLATLQNQMKEAQEELKKPWPHEETFRAKTARLAELEARLTLEEGSGSKTEADMEERPKLELPAFADRLSMAQEKATAVNARRQVGREPILMTQRT